jgi:hypothetical protein
MDEPELRRRRGAVDTNVNDVVNVNAVVDPAPAAKKTKRIPRIFTLSVDHSPIQVQVLSTQTIYDLVDIICRNATIGQSESVTGHEWNVRLSGGASLLLWRISFGIETSCSQSSTCGFWTWCRM